MHNKKGIRYLRYSSDGQSKSSIEFQDAVTASWFQSNKIDLVNTYIDRGYSAQNFDRPDWKMLEEFIKKNHKHADYLVVSESDRFSRDSGEAISKMKQLFVKYQIQFVSVLENITYNYFQPGNHFRASLNMLLAEDNNISRKQKILGGIYAAKTEDCRWIGSHHPYGYRKTGKGKQLTLEIFEPEAAIIRMIFEEFLAGSPMAFIYQMARERGLKTRGHSVIPKIISNPVYCAHQYVKPYRTETRDLPGGLFAANWPPIIDWTTWNKAQVKLKRKEAPSVKLSDEFPMRGILHCHCGRQLTAANSRGKLGNWYGYYKCNTASAHNNISATKAHQQLDEILDILSFDQDDIDEIRYTVYMMYQEQFKEEQKQKKAVEKELAKTNEMLRNVEELYIQKQFPFESYQRWHTDLNNKRRDLADKLAVLCTDHREVLQLVEEEIGKLTTLKYIYNSCTTVEKQHFISAVFDNGLSYKEGIYRTPSLLEVFQHNELILKEKKLLLIEKNGDSETESPEVEPQGTGSNSFIRLLMFFGSLDQRVA